MIEQEKEEIGAGIPHALGRDGTGLEKKEKKTSVSAQRH